MLTRYPQVTYSSFVSQTLPWLAGRTTPRRILDNLFGYVCGVRHYEHFAGLVPWAVDPPVRRDATGKGPRGSVRFRIPAYATPLLTHADIQLCHSIRPGSRRDRHIILDLVPYLCTGRVEGSEGYPRQTNVLSIWHDFEVLLPRYILLRCQLIS